MNAATTSSFDGCQVRRDSGEWRAQTGCDFRTIGWGALYAILLSLPIAASGGWMIYRDYSAVETSRAVLAERMRSHDRLVAAAPGAMLPVEGTAHGRDLFTSTCAACHNADGTGVAGLGKPLTTSWFVASIGDNELNDFVKHGRPALHPDNTTRVGMPPKGGRPELTDADLGDIVLYVRGLQDARRLPALPAPVAVAVGPITEEDKAKALAAAGGDAELAEYIAHGTKIFAATCAACHGGNGRGLQGLGKDIVASDFAKKLDDDGLLAFVKRGRDPGDPLNTTKVGMPPKGGNPALSDDDLLDVISYVRSLQKQTGVTP